MHHSAAELAAILNLHDGSSGFAGRMCPACGVMHPCPTYRLAADVVESQERAAYVLDRR